MTKTRKFQSNKGVILLAVVSLLTLFVLIGTTYVVVSNNYRHAAVVNAEQAQYVDSSSRQLESALYQLIRDTHNINSVIRGHSLLRDKYGHNIMNGRIINDVTQITYMSGYQILQFRCFFSGAAPGVEGTLNGCVLTFLGGPLHNQSTHITYYARDIALGPNAAIVRILVPETDAQITMPTTAYVNQAFMVNDREFNGTGFAYDNTGAYNRRHKVSTQALLPNRIGQTTGSGTYNHYIGMGADEGYDVPDFQNVHLAGIIPNPNNKSQTYVIPSFHRPALVNYWINQNAGATWLNSSNTRVRSIMRPMPWDHPNFTGGNEAFQAHNGNFLTFSKGPDGAWGIAGQDDDGDGVIDNQAEMGAPGSDDQNSLVYGPWDVDNDEDGTPDSVWVDLGFPIQTDSDGRRYKPLFAILCTDLDGRLSLNAHGNQSQSGPQTTHSGVKVAGGNGTSGLTNQGALFPEDLRHGIGFGFGRGQGTGPAEVNLYHLFKHTVDRDSVTYNWSMAQRLGPYQQTVVEYRRLMFGDQVNGIPGRYGTDNSPGAPLLDFFTPIRFIDYPVNFFGIGAGIPVMTPFQSPADLHGELAFSLNGKGQPIWEGSTVAGQAVPRNTLIDNPYELNLLKLPGTDGAYSVSELERLLRYHDADTEAIPDRLTKLTTIFTDPSIRRLVTTHSFDSAAPTTLTPETLRNSVGHSGNIRALYRRRLIQGLGGFAGTPIQLDQLLSQQVAVNLPWELQKGVRMNANRPWGNSRDDNNNFVVDEHWQSGTQNVNEAHPLLDERIWNQNIRVDHDNDGITSLNGGDPDAFVARQLFARHLYTLAMLLKDDGHYIDLNENGNNDDVDGTVAGGGAGGGPGGNAANETQYGLAQWAVNVVDFRDADSIMTPFEFDLNPFNGVPVNGFDGRIGTVANPSADDQHPDRAVVWGCERPELLISETFAFHDRRTEDLDTDSSGKTTTDNNNPDDDFDQRLRPRSGVFIELYNPWSGSSARPAELHRDYANGVDSGGVRLNQLSLVGNSPVWRVLIYRDPNIGPNGVIPDPDNPNANALPDPDNYERGIYFVDPQQNAIIPTGRQHGREQFYTSLNIAPILPGRYGVVGSAGKQMANNRYVNLLGRTTNAVTGGGLAGLDIPNTRRIELVPDPDPTVANQVRVYNNPDGWGDATNNGLLPPVAVPINMKIDVNGQPQVTSLTVTEPANGYQTVFGDIDGDTEADVDPPLDEPLDQRFVNDPVTGLSRQALLDRSGGTRPKYAIAYLQRLANPLVPYDASTNPYRTLDAMSVDVTSFNGVTSDSMDADVMNSPINEDVRFRAHQRGDRPPNIPVQPITARDIWSHDRSNIDNQAVSPQAANADHVFNYDLLTTLGYLNRGYGPYLAGAGVNANNLGDPDHINGNGHPFPWLTWLNRPFVSSYELMQVPHTRSSQLLRRFSLARNVDVYNPPGGAAPGNSRFGHLMNFFESTNNPNAVAGGGAGNTAANLHRIFEFVSVPSPFIGAQTFLNPVLFGQFRAGNDHYYPPFNWVSRMRDPGKINVNTVYDSVIWQALFNQPNIRFQDTPNTAIGVPTSAINRSSLHHAHAPFASSVANTRIGFADSRRGYGSAGDNITSFNPGIPTFFANPVRPSGSGDLVPLSSMERPDIEATLLRSNAITMAGGARNIPANRIPLLMNSYVDATDKSRDVRRNSHFRYQDLTKIQNKVTTKSNVYATWITVGYFEVDSRNRLGQELGADRGDTERHRAFYVIDRSIPTAFEVGQNHNVDRAVILKRYIE